MKKIKKILLAFAPLTAIAIATPIVLTSCSDTTTNTTTPDVDNGNGGTGGGSTGGGSGEVSKPITPSFSKDNTNSVDFALDASSEAQKILEKYKIAKGQVAAEKVLTDELANFPKKDSGTLAKDVLNMWSNNNWFTITKMAKDEKVKETFISNLTINKAEVIQEGGKNKATFDVQYKNSFVDSTGKLYEATQVLKADKVEVDASTKIEIAKEIPGNSYKIDGKDQPLTPASFLENSVSNPKTNLENILKQPKVSLDAKLIFDAYIKNHNIKFAPEETKPPIENLKAPIWNTTAINTYKTYLSIDSKNASLLIFDISKANGSNIFGNLATTHPYATVQKVLTAKIAEISKLITVNDYKVPDNSKMTLGQEAKDGNVAYADVTISFDKIDGKTGTDTNPTLIFRFKGFKAK